MLQTNKWVVLALAPLLATLLASSCTKLSSDDKGAMNSTTSPSESALATVNSLANDSESVTLVDAAETETNLLKPSCKTQSAKSDCNANNQINVNWGECSAPSGATYKGGWTSTYSSTNACMRAKTSPLANGDSVNRTSPGMTIENGSGSRISWNTNLHTTYDGQTISNAGLSVSLWGGTRSMDVAGLHRLFQNSSGATLYDHSILSLSPVNVSGQRTSGNRTATGGTFRVYSNTDKTRTDITFSNLQWRNASCCFPTSGSLTAVTSGNKMNTISIRFDRPTCGQVSIDQDGKTTLGTLQQCE